MRRCMYVYKRKTLHKVNVCNFQLCGYIRMYIYMYWYTYIGQVRELQDTVEYHETEIKMNASVGSKQAKMIQKQQQSTEENTEKIKQHDKQLQNIEVSMSYQGAPLIILCFCLYNKLACLVG